MSSVITNGFTSRYVKNWFLYNWYNPWMKVATRLYGEKRKIRTLISFSMIIVQIIIGSILTQFLIGSNASTMFLNHHLEYFLRSFHLHSQPSESSIALLFLQHYQCRCHRHDRIRYNLHLFRNKCKCRILHPKIENKFFWRSRH